MIYVIQIKPVHIFKCHFYVKLDLFHDRIAPCNHNYIQYNIYEIKRKELDEEELELSKQFISTVESEEFFKNPNEDNKTLVEEAKKHKEIFNKRKGQALLHKKKIEVKQKELDDKVNLLSQDKKELYEVICNLILGKKDNSNGENQEEKNKMIKNNQGLIRVISSKCDKLKKVKNLLK